MNSQLGLSRLSGSAPSSATKWPKVVTYSAFRNIRKEVKGFFEKRDRLTYPQDRLQHFCLEGDSDDDTFELLKEEASKRTNVIVKKADFNSPHITGFVHPGRAVAMSNHSNFALRALLNETDADYVLLIESDLDYPPDLIERLLRTEKSFVAPMIMVKGTDNFYDTYAFRKLMGTEPEGNTPAALGCFESQRPFHAVYRDDEVFEVDSAGSCLFFHKDVIRRGAQFSPKGLIVAFCQSAKEKGFPIWIDPTTVVWHPVVDHAANPKKWEPWHETKVTMKYQAKVPVDPSALELGKKLGFGKPLEFAWIAQRLHRYLGAKTLDVGQLQLTLPSYWARLGFDVDVVQPPHVFKNAQGEVVSMESLHKSAMGHLGVRYRFFEAPPEKLPFEDAHFDQVISIGNVGFHEDDRAVVKELYRVCKPNGKLFLTLPYDHHTFWWDHCDGGAPARYYYNFQAVMDRIVSPLGAILKDFAFIRYELPSEGKPPSFTYPCNSGIIVLELEKHGE